MSARDVVANRMHKHLWVPAGGLVVLVIARNLFLFAARQGVIELDHADTSELSEFVVMAVRVLVGAAMLAYDLLLVVGAVAMIRRRGIKVARLAAILACVPLGGPLYWLDVPFGLLALAVLYSKHVEGWEK